jgi:DNA-binding transcriptional LysR family regulator
MNLKAIRLFLHTVQRGSLVAAARKLNMSASAASRLLTSFEVETGLTLFSRDKHRLSPTVEGQEYYSECHRVLLAVDDLARAAQRLAHGGKTRLRVISTPRYATYFMVSAIERFLKTNPEVEINLEVVLRYDSEPIYSGRPFDLGVVGIPLKHATVDTEPLFDMPCTAIMRRDHPLAKRPFVRASDLTCERIVALEAGTRRGDEMQEVFEAEGVPLKPQFTVTNLDIACQLVLKVNAITVDEPWVPLALDPCAYALVPLKPHRKVEVGIVTPPWKPESRLTAVFKTCLREEAKIVEHRLARYFGSRIAASQKGAASRRGAHPYPK